MGTIVSWVVLFLFVIAVLYIARFVMKLTCLVSSLITAAIVAAGVLLIVFLFIL